MSERHEIEYPCRWTFQLIGEDEQTVRAAVVTITDGEAHEIERSRSSRTGKYVSLRLQIVVRDETHRLALQRGFAASAAIRYVL